MPIFPPNLSIQDQECAQTLSTAIENGDLATVRRVLTTWPWQPRAGFDSGDDIADLWPFKAVLSGAIESGNTELASYVLGCGLKAELYVTMLALDLGSIDMYQVLVDHGWDINMPLSQGNPPLLAYVSLTLPSNCQLSTWPCTLQIAQVSAPRRNSDPLVSSPWSITECPRISLLLYATHDGQSTFSFSLREALMRSHYIAGECASMCSRIGGPRTTGGYRVSARPGC